MVKIIDTLDCTLILLANYICAIYIFYKTNKIQLTRKGKVIILLYSIFISSFCAYLRNIEFVFYGFIFFILMLISFIHINKNKIYISLPNAILAIGISYCLEIASTLLLISPFFLIGYYNTNILTEIITSILQFLLAFLFTKIKRVQNGFTFFNNKNYFGIGIIITGPIIILTSIDRNFLSFNTKTIVAVAILISMLGLFIWIHSTITHYYRKRLKLRAEEYSKIELSEKQKEIEKLSSENASLSSIIHLDNYIISTLEASLDDLQTVSANSKSIDDLRALTKQRNAFVSNKIINDKFLPTTGSSEIDEVLTELYIKAASRGIDFALNVDCDINYLIHNIIEQTDFEELIRGCITSSIVDIESNPDNIGKIFINISKPNDIYEFTIMDNGIFNDENIKSISEIIHKSNARIKTNEFDNSDSFTKSLTIRFDGLG